MKKGIRSTASQKPMEMVKIDTGHGDIEVDMDMAVAEDELEAEDEAVNGPGIRTLATVD